MPSPRKIFVQGEWRETARKTTIRNPYDGRPVSEMFVATEVELEQALAAAAEAVPVGRRMQTFERELLLRGIAAGIEERAQDFADAIMFEAGKPITFARGEVARGINTFRLAAEECKRIPGELMQLDSTRDSPHRTGLIRRVPAGPVTAISPFNFPLNLVAHKVAPALAVGNPVIVKPASQTPLTALLLAEVASRAGWPPGMLQVTPCPGALAGSLVTSPIVKVVSFTGSPAIGWKLKEQAVRKKVTLELGGNAAVVVEPDADLDFAAARTALGAFAYAGQVCISVQRAFVHDRVYDEFRDRLLAAVAANIHAGDPRDERTVVGPVIDDESAVRIECWVEKARAAGASVLCGGQRQGRMIQPTVLEGVDPSLELSCREVFGPVLVLARYRRFEEALAAVNDSVYGLQAGVFTRDLPRAWQAFRELEVGGVVINDFPMYRADQMPYGGVKESGFGREGLRWAIEEMTEPRLLVLNFATFPEAQG